MDSFDEIIKNKINNEKWVIPENIDKSMDNILKNLESKKLKKNTIKSISCIFYNYDFKFYYSFS